MLIRFKIVLLFALCTTLSATQQSSVDLEKLNSLFQEFRYNEVILQGDEMLNQNPDISVNDKCEIYRLLALSFYNLQDMRGALRNFSMILRLNVNYRLDPRKNSPKILSFFEEIRNQVQTPQQESKQQKQDSLLAAPTVVYTDSLERAAYRRMALSFALPGSGQIWQGEKIKGWFLLGGNLTLLGATIYFASETNRLSDQYLQIHDPAEIDAAYSKYNEAYKRRNLALTGFLILWLYTQVDFIFLSSYKSPHSAISWQPSIDSLGQARLEFVIKF